MKRIAWIQVFVFLLFAFTCLVTPGSQAEDKVITLKVSNWFPVGHKQDALLQEWGKELEKRSAGKVKVNYYAAGTLVPAAQSYDAAVKGIADVSNHVLGYTIRGASPFPRPWTCLSAFPPAPALPGLPTSSIKNSNPRNSTT